MDVKRKPIIMPLGHYQTLQQETFTVSGGLRAMHEKGTALKLW